MKRIPEQYRRKGCLLLALLLMMLALNACTAAKDAGENGNITMSVLKKSDNGNEQEQLILVYDGEGNLLTHQNGSRITRFTYDESGKMLSKTLYFAGSEEPREQTNYIYDKAGRLVKTDGFGYAEVYTEFASSYEYDESGNLIRLKNYTNGEVFEEFVYDSNGALIEEYAYYGGNYDLYITYIYASDGKLLEKRTNQGGSLYGGVDYVYDDAGCLLREEKFIIQDSERKESTATYTYDAEGRCVRWDIIDYQGNNNFYEYTYDAAGNMLSQMYTDQEDTSGYLWSYDAQGRMTSVQFMMRANKTKYIWTYDDQDNVKTLTVDTGSAKYSYKFSYTGPDANLPPQILEEIEGYIASFVQLSGLSPENHAAINHR